MPAYAIRDAEKKLPRGKFLGVEDVVRGGSGLIGIAPADHVVFPGL